MIDLDLSMTATDELRARRFAGILAWLAERTGLFDSTAFLELTGDDLEWLLKALERVRSEVR